MRLGVNLDHVATIRQARMEIYPDPVQAALLAELGGADNITCHLREDRRHISDRDIRLLKEVIKIPLNFEMAATEEMVKIALQLQPHSVTLVPEKRQELTTEGGLNLASDHKLASFIDKLKSANINVALFVEAEQQLMSACKKMNADAVELHTGNICKDLDQTIYSRQKVQIINQVNICAQTAFELGLQVHLGHGINYGNAKWFQGVKKAEEANIGHAIVARAVFVGLTNAVSEMKNLIANPACLPKEFDLYS